MSESVGGGKEAPGDDYYAGALCFDLLCFTLLCFGGIKPRCLPTRRPRLTDYRVRGGLGEFGKLTQSGLATRTWIGFPTPPLPKHLCDLARDSLTLACYYFNVRGKHTRSKQSSSRSSPTPIEGIHN